MRRWLLRWLLGSLLWQAWRRGRRWQRWRRSSDNPRNWKSLDYIQAQVEGQIKAQFDVWRLLDDRLRLVLGVIGIVFTAVLAFQRTAAPVDPDVVYLLRVAMIYFFLAGLIAAFSYMWGMDLDWPPHPTGLREGFLTTPERETRLTVIDTVVAAYTENERRIVRRARAFFVAFGLTIVATMLLAMATWIHIGSAATGVSQPQPGLRTPTPVPALTAERIQ